MSLVNIWNKSSFSFFDSILSVDKIIENAINNKQEYVSLVDTNHMYGAYDFYLKAIKNNLKPIIGIEFNIENNKFILIAKNYQGYKNISKISSIVSTKDNSEILLRDIKKYVSDLIFINLNNENNLLNADDFFYVGKESLFLKKVTYGNIKDKKARDLFYLVGQSKTIDNLNEVEETSHFLSTKEIENSATPSQIDNLKKLLSSINLELPVNSKVNFAKYKNKEDNYEELKKLCELNLKKYIKEYKIINSKAYIERAQYELNVIKKMKFSNYFLIVADYVNWARTKNILVGPGRGSSGGSLVAFILKITEIDPIKYNLIFERFLNPERVSMPDIDVDFQDDRREEVLNYILDKYGKDYVAQIITFQTLRAKMSLKDIARVSKIDLKKIEAVSKLIPTNSDFEEALKTSKKFKQTVEADKEVKDLVNIARKIEGLPRQFSTHAAGIVITKNKLIDSIPVQSGYSNFLITQYSMEHLESNGIIKLDILGLKNLTIISDILKEIKKTKKIDLKLENINLQDKKTISLLGQGKTEGIFQLESPGMKSTLIKIKANSLEDIIATTSLYRPGPSENIPEFAKRKKGEISPDYLDKDLEDILKETYGIIVYQEQIIQIVQKFSLFSPAKADIFRKAIGKKDADLLVQLKQEFEQGALSNGKEEQLTRKVYDLIFKFANYGFNKSHAASYSIISFWMLYLKSNYPLEFYSSLMSSYIGNFSKIQTYYNEAKQLGIKINGPSVNKSSDKFLITNKEILYPLTSIFNFGSAAYKEIENDKDKNGKYKDLIDFILRINTFKFSSSSLSALINSGALSEFNYNRKTIEKNLESIQMYADLVIIKKDGIKVIDPKNLETVKKPIINEVEGNEQEDNDLIFKYIGINLNENNFEKAAKKLSNTNLKITTLEECHDLVGQDVNLIVNIVSERQVKTKYGSMMIFGTLADSTGQFPFSVSPRYFNNISDKIKRGENLLLRVKIDKYKGGTISIMEVINEK